MDDVKMYRRRNKQFLLFYTLMFCAAAALAFAPFFQAGKSFVWNSDARGQYLPNLYYLYERIGNAFARLFGKPEGADFSAFSYACGLGGDASSLYFKGILDYLGVLLGKESLEQTFRVIILLRIYSSGLSFAALAFYWKQPVRSVIPGALVYAFTGFSMYYGMRHMSFLIPLIMLPLLILGTEKILREEKPWVFLISVFYQAWTDYYFLYMSTLILAVYVCVRWAEIRDWKKISRSMKIMAGCYGIGLALAAVSLCSKIVKYFDSGRGKSVTVESGSLLSYGRHWIYQFFSRLFSPYVTDDYQKYYMPYAVPAIAALAVVGLFFTKNRRLVKMKIWVLAGTLFFFFPAAAFLFSGFNSLVNRWNYAYMLLLAMVVTVMLPYMEKIDGKTAVVMACLVTVFCFLAVYRKEEKSIYIGVCAVSAALLLYFAAVYGAKKCGDSLIFYEIITVMAVANIGVNGRYIYAEKEGGFSKEFVDSGMGMSAYEQGGYAYADEISDEAFYRVETGQYQQNQANAPRIFNCRGTAGYDSTMAEAGTVFSGAVCNRGQVSKLSFYGFDNRAWLEALGCVGYYIAPGEETCNVPYGFQRYKEVTRGGITKCIYKNNYTLPIGYTYESYIPQAKAKQLHPLKLQQKMLQTAVLLDSPGTAGTDIEIKEEKNEEAVQLEEIRCITEPNNLVQWRGGQINVKRANAEVIMHFENPANAEVYFMMEGLDIDQAADRSFSMQIHGPRGCSKSIWVFCSNDKYRTQNYQDYCVNLGYFKKKEQNQCRITFPQAGVYKVKSVKLYAVPMDKYPEFIQELEADSLQDVKLGEDWAAGTLRLKKNKILCMSIPYSRFWKAYIDGSEVKTECVNYMWLGVPVTKGKHSIEFVYSNTAVTAGAYISLGMLAVLLVIGTVKHHCKKAGSKNEN